MTKWDADPRCNAPGVTNKDVCKSCIDKAEALGMGLRRHGRLAAATATKKPAAASEQKYYLLTIIGEFVVKGRAKHSMHLLITADTNNDEPRLSQHWVHYSQD
eukprot:scaffold3909_cov138-Skeletonema_marinoi.AAC.1